MENKKLDEFKKTPLTKEESAEYFQNLLVKLRKDGDEVEQWIENLKQQYGVTDENL